MIKIAIRATFYIFWFFLLLFCFLVFLLFFFSFLIIQSQAAFVNCLYVARFTIVHSKTEIKFPLLLLLLLLLLLFLLLYLVFARTLLGNWSRKIGPLDCSKICFLFCFGFFLVVVGVGRVVGERLTHVSSVFGLLLWLATQRLFPCTMIREWSLKKNEITTFFTEIRLRLDYYWGRRYYLWGEALGDFNCIYI